MLASIRDYMFWWQIPLLFIFVTGWIFGGGYLLKRACLKRDYDERKISSRRAYLIMAASGVTAAFTGLVIFFLFWTIGTALGLKILYITTFLTAIASISAAYLIFYVMLELPAKDVLKVSLQPLAAVYILGAIIAAIAAWPASTIRMTNLKKNLCTMPVHDISVALITYESKFGRPAPSLETLIEKGILDAGKLKLELLPNSDSGYIYAPASFRGEPNPQRIVLASKKVPDLDGRIVLFATREVRWCSEEEFQKLLRVSENRNISEADKTSGD